MKKKQLASPAPELPKSVKVDPVLSKKYAEGPFFQQKVDRANYILKIFGRPKAELLKQIKA